MAWIRSVIFFNCWLFSSFPLFFRFPSSSFPLICSSIHSVVHSPVHSRLSFFPFLSTPMSYQPFSFTHFRSSCFFLSLALSTYQSHARSFLFSLLVSFTRPHDRGQEVEVRELGSLVYSCVSSLLDLYQ